MADAALAAAKTTLALPVAMAPVTAEPLPPLEAPVMAVPAPVRRRRRFRRSRRCPSECATTSAKVLAFAAVAHHGHCKMRAGEAFAGLA